MKNKYEIRITSIIYAATLHLCLLIILFSVQKEYFKFIDTLKDHNLAYNSIKAETAYEAGSSQSGNPTELPKVENDLLSELPEIPAPSEQPTPPIILPKDIPIIEQEEPMPETKEIKEIEEIKPPVKHHSMNLPKFKGKAKESAIESKNNPSTELPGQSGVREEGRKGVGLEESGGDSTTEEAVEEGLQWLASVQDDDGKWDSDGFMEHYIPGATDNERYMENPGRTYSDIGITGLCLLAFTGIGNTHETGKYSNNIALAKKFLLSEQRSEGGFGKTNWAATMYDHALATLALADLYLISKDNELKKPLEKAIKYLIDQQNLSGGWDYDQCWGKKPTSTRGDLSISCFAIMAVVSCKAAGIPISKEFLLSLKEFLTKYTTESGSGIYANQDPRHESSIAITAAASFARKLLGEKSTSSIQKKQLEIIKKNKPTSPNPNPQQEVNGIWYLYYGALRFSIDKKDHENEWNVWNTLFKNVVIQHRCKTGKRKGSFNPSDIYSSWGGRLCSTAMSILCLQVYYRLTPAYLEKSKELDYLWE